MTIQKTLLDLNDPIRHREVPVCLYEPQAPAQGWVLFSVGFGGNRDGYAYLARAWAGLGLATAVVEHVGSNLDVLRSLSGGSREERNQEVVRRVQEPQELEARPIDLSYAHEQLRPRFGGLPLALGGHSFGAYTVMASCGLPPRPLQQAVPVIEEVTSVLAISPQPPGMLFEEPSYAELKHPCLILTGTEDSLLNGAADYRERERVFELLPQDNRHLAILDGVGHMDFAAVGLGLEKTLSQVGRLTAAWWESTILKPQPSWARGESLRTSLTVLSGRVE